MENLATEIVDHLHSLYGNRKISILEICPQIENTIPDLISKYLLKEIELYTERIQNKFQLIRNPLKLEKRLPLEEHFIFNSNDYELKISENTSQSENLVITIRDIGKQSRDEVIRKDKIEFDFRGRYTRIDFNINECFSDILHSLVDTSQIIIETSYRRMEEYVKQAIEKMKDETGDALYEHIRRVFVRKPELVNDIWLYVEIDNHGIYTMDTAHRNIVLERTAERLRNINSSPIELAVRIFTERTPFGMTYSGKSVKEDATITDNLSSASYIGSGIQIAEERIYKCDSHSCQPLVREGKNLLSACYPAKLTSEIEPILQKERKTFKEILSQKSNSIKKVVNILEQRNFIDCGLAPKVFECIGALLKGSGVFPPV